MKYEHVEVKLDATGRGTVLLNGTPLKGVRAVSLKSECDGMTEVTITLIANVNCDV